MWKKTLDEDSSIIRHHNNRNVVPGPGKLKLKAVTALDRKKDIFEFLNKRAALLRSTHIL